MLGHNFRGRISRVHLLHGVHSAAYSSRLTAVTSAEGATRHGEARRAPVIHAPRGGTRIRRPPVKDSFVAYHALEVTSRPTDLIANTPCCSRGPLGHVHGMEFESAHFHPIFSLHSRICSYVVPWTVYGALTTVWPQIDITDLTSKQLTKYSSHSEQLFWLDSLFLEGYLMLWWRFTKEEDFVIS